MTASWRSEASKKISEMCIEHQRFADVTTALFNNMTFAQPGEIVAVVGPSRVGKSRSADMASYRLAGAGHPKEIRAVVKVEAENSSRSGTFSTKSFMRSCLVAIDHPIYGGCFDDDEYRSKLDARINRTPEGVLRDALEHAIAVRKTRYLIVDEAHHIAYSGKSAASALSILESWKCLANKTGVVLVLVAGNRLLELVTLASHLIGRLKPIHFSRYRHEHTPDVAAFEQILHTWDQHIQFHGQDSLRRWNSYLFTHSFGCIGHLSNWIRSALAYCETHALDALTKEALESTRQLPAFGRTILDEIEIGERFFDPNRTPTAGTSDALKRSVHTQKPFRRKPERYERGGRS